MTIADPLAPVSPLAAAELVCHHARDGDFDGMRDIVQLISDFADYSVTPFWSLPRASEQRDLRLMQRLAARESPTMDEYHRAFLFNEALVHAVEAAASREEEGARERGMAMIEWLCKSYCPRALVTNGMVEAARHGDLEVMEWLVTHHERVIWYDTCGSAAAEGGHLHVLQWLHIRGVLSSRWVHEALPEACTNGDHESIQYLLWLGANSCGSSMNRAAVNGNLDVLKLLANVFESSPSITIEAAYVAAANNQLEVLQWLSPDLPAASVSLMISNAAANGHLEIVQWLHTDCSEHCSTRAMDSAARIGRLDILKWLHENCNAGCSTQAMNCAAQNGYLEVVQWLHENRTEGCTTGAMDSAVLNGHLEVVQWLHKNRGEGCTLRAMDDAARIGRLDILEWLAENRSEGCTFRAMTNAAQNGYFDVVEWLAENRSEGCTPMALTMTAGSGHFGILLWLHARYNIDCTANALVLAAEAGHLDIVKWLYTTFEHLDLTVGAIDAASTLEVLEWLRANGVEGCTSRALDSALSRNNFDKLAFLRTHYPDVSCSREAVDSATGTNCIEGLLWLHANFPEQVDIPLLRSFYEQHHWVQVFDIIEGKSKVDTNEDAAEAAHAEPTPEP